MIKLPLFYKLSQENLIFLSLQWYKQIWNNLIFSFVK